LTFTIVDFEQPVRDVDAEIRVDPHQVGIERGMMDSSAANRS
jgi:hypothetical protein